MESLEHNLPEEEIIDEGKGVLIREKNLYHGSSVIGIEKMNPAEETTVGEGIYFTSKPEDARGYAIRRSRLKENGEPVVYNAKIENLKFFDARSDINTKEVLNGFLVILNRERQRKDLPWNYEYTLDEAIEKIKNNEVGAGNLRLATFAHGKLFTDYIKSLGYDGLITIEGGEGDDIGAHDTYLVFDPDKIKDLSVE